MRCKHAAVADDGGCSRAQLSDRDRAGLGMNRQSSSGTATAMQVVGASTACRVARRCCSPSAWIAHRSS
ncbi:hypothetical protein BURMUCF2_A1974 [Burkholderia multivorans CF2]|nr:hypothetical protein BURMUCF2_A1974 [Burkholderia multivorans CF2]